MNEEKKEPEENSEVEEQKPDRWELLLKEFSSAIFPLLVTMAAAITLSAFFFENSPFLSTSGKSSESQKMFAYLAKGVERGEFSDEFFNTAFNHFDRKSKGELTKYGRIETIEDFVVYLNSNHDDKEKLNIEPVEQFLAKTKEVEPFSALPAEERRLMDQLQLLVSDKENLQPVIQTLNELKQVILARHKEYQRIEAQNTWSLPLSFIGVFLTLVFGIWTTVLSIRQIRSRYRNMRGEWVQHSADGRIRRVVVSE